MKTTIKFLYLILCLLIVLTIMKQYNSSKSLSIFQAQEPFKKDLKPYIVDEKKFLMECKEYIQKLKSSSKTNRNKKNANTCQCYHDTLTQFNLPLVSYWDKSVRSNVPNSLQRKINSRMSSRKIQAALQSCN